jgi:heat shock protein HslJ
MKTGDWIAGLALALALGLAAGTGCEPSAGGRTDGDGTEEEGQQEGGDGQDEGAQDPATDPAALRGTTWLMRSYGQHGTNVRTIPGTAVTLVFHPDGTLEGSGGCNDYSASYKAKGDGTLAVWDLMSTSVHCTSPAGVGAQETRYFDRMRKATEFRFAEDGNLVIYYPGGLMLFD